MHQGCKVSNHVLGNKHLKFLKYKKNSIILNIGRLQAPAKNIKNIIKGRNRSKKN